MIASFRTHQIHTIVVIAFIFSLHVVIPMYSNSSFLSLFADSSTVGVIYMAGAALSIFGFLFIPALIRKLGNYPTSLLLICLQIVLFYGLISVQSPLLLSVIFIVQSAVSLLIGFCIDIFLEVYTVKKSLGQIRGLYISAINASWVMAPFIGSLLIGDNNNYRNTYIAALAMLFPLLYIVYRNFPRFEDPNYHHPSPWKTIQNILAKRNWSMIFLANLILQIFYAWMVVYSPIYLNKIIGFGWKEIGIIIVITLLPFILIQYPLGKLSDGNKCKGKNIMAIGFAIMALSTMSLSFFVVNNFLVWAILLFVTRIGAATAEIMIETDFFRVVPTNDTEVLGLFRISRPISMFIAPALMIILSTFIPFQYMFLIIGLISLIAVYPSLQLKNNGE